jgi:lysophospholipase L1-like esterase
MTRRQALIAGLASLTACSAHLENLAKPLNLVFEGDSLTAGNGSTAGNAYPNQVVTLLDEQVTSHNFAVGGSTLSSELPTRESTVDQAFIAGAMNVCIAWASTNDLKGGFDPGYVMGLYSAYLSRRKARGYRTIAISILPRYSSTTPASFESARQTFNTSLRANWRNFADALADVAADPRIGDAGDEFDTTLYADQVHLTDAGYAIVAGLVTFAITELP